MRSLIALLALVLTGPAQAGDPCPIDYTFYDLGAPSWLDRDALLAKLTSKDSWFGASFKNAPDAVKITRIWPGSPAEKAGLKVGDLVSTANGAAMKTHQAFAGVLRATLPGKPVALTVGGKALSVTLAATDPLVGALMDHASAQECSDVSRGTLEPKQREVAMAAVFSKLKRFRCEDAHKALAKADLGDGRTLEGGELVIVRGSKRLIMESPGWATVCVKAAHYDGAKLTPKALKSLFTKLSSGYTSDRHNNP